MQQIRPRWYRPADSDRARESRVRSVVDCEACMSFIDNGCCREDSAASAKVAPALLDDKPPMGSQQQCVDGRDPACSAGEPTSAAEAEPVSHRDAGMSTVEYAVGTVVAAAFAAVLYRIVTGDSVISGLTNLINTALSTSF